ncbi:MAG: UDP-N-acetylmuramate dehydrogenase, partial [Myxococcales bacterium]|nr:UDP-N-acetylmuramate dehydrogenase [Myxococcales bacterium]
MTAQVLRRGEVMATVEVSLIGDHNLLNVIAVTALCLGLGLTEAEIAAGMASFKGIRRRQEVVAEVGGVTILDDFAHHPTAVAVTIAAVRRRFAGRRVWAVFEPRSNTSRRNIFQAQYPLAFAAAHKALIASPQNVDSIAEGERMDAGRLATDVTALGGDARALP